MTPVRRAALKILRPHVAALRSYGANHPMPSPPQRRAWPTENFVWRRYLSSMLTAMTRSSNELWDGLRADPDWKRLRDGGPRACWRVDALERFFVRHRVRFPAQKAERLRRSAHRDFEGLAREARAVFRDVHDRRPPPWRRREAEVELAVLLQRELAGCGVAPKIARLALMGAREVSQIIPIDSRWQNALRRMGVDIGPSDLADERRYRVLEDELCEAAYALGVRPTDADGVPFGWLFDEDSP